MAQKVLYQCSGADGFGDDLSRVYALMRVEHSESNSHGVFCIAVRKNNIGGAARCHKIPPSNASLGKAGA